MVGDREVGGMATTEFSVVCHCGFTFYRISKKTKLRLVFVSFNFSILLKCTGKPIKFHLIGNEKKVMWQF